MLKMVLYYKYMKERFLGIMARMLPTAKKLITALGTKGLRLTLSTKQFIGHEGQPHDMFIISEARWNNEKHKYINNELYSSVSPVRIVLYLRDMWYEVNGWDLPQDQELWNQIREQVKEEKANGKYRKVTL